MGTKRILQGIVRQAKTLSGCTTTCDLLLSSVSPSTPKSPYIAAEGQQGI